MRFIIPLLTLPLLTTSVLHAEDKPAAWWNKAWTQRQALTLDTSAASSDASGAATVLVRLHDGNFQFTNATEGGADLRFIASDGKTSLPYQVEKWDSLLNEAFVWVRLPEITAGGKTTAHLYYGGGDPAVAAPDKAKTYGDESMAVHHFSDATPADATANGNNANAAATLAEGSLIGRGLRLPAPAPLSLAGSDTLNWTQGQDLGISFWIKPASLQANAVLISRGGLKIILDQGVPLIESAGQRSTAGAPVAAGSWHHIALVSKDGGLQLFLDGKAYGQLAATLPASTDAINIGHATGNEAFIGELDELHLTKTAPTPGAIQLAFANQGSSEAAQRTLFLGEVEGGESGGGHSEALEHVMLFGDIAKNMMFDGWIAIGVCVVMIVVGWTVALKKFAYLNSIQKGSKEFLRQWKTLSSDLTALDHTDDKNIRTLGGNAASNLSVIEKSPLYEIYHIGSEEIRHRLARDKERTKGLSGRSIQAIRAALDAGLVRAQHKLTNGLVYLTISIAGGPYVGLLGTVVGVMITFAIIAKSGEVDVNSIAPGIASALLATVAGLIVAIPALFIYSYLNNRIKNTVAEIQVFIDEFIAKMAEFYPPAGEISPYAPSNKNDH